jgi:hypothetical protein
MICVVIEALYKLMLFTLLYFVSCATITVRKSQCGSVENIFESKNLGIKKYFPEKATSEKLQAL